jgi:predicted DNA-binding protein (MmcQ/YjbR family)
MNIDWVRELCCGLAGATEQVQWGDDLVFKVGGKMFAVAPLEPGAAWLSFKSTHEEFAELTERPGIRPAAYLARAHWVSLESESALPRAEVERLVRQSYLLVLAKLPRKAQAKLTKGAKGSQARRGTKKNKR